MGFYTTGMMNSTSGAAQTVAQSLLANRANATTPTTAASAASTAGITSDDFLTLLVTEMKNQDPTQPTDPNAYVQQLVGVNSLQQLIAINQDLTPAATPASQTGPVASVSGS